MIMKKHKTKTNITYVTKKTNLATDFINVIHNMIK